MTTIPHPQGDGRQQPDPDSYTIQDAAFANAAGDAATIATAEADAIAVSAADTPALWDKLLAWRDAGGTIAAYVAPTRNQVLARDVVAGWTPDDLVLIEALAKTSAEARLFLKQLDTRAEKPMNLDSDDFQRAWTLMTAAVGAPRAAAMMAALRTIAR